MLALPSSPSDLLPPPAGPNVPSGAVAVLHSDYRL